MNIQIHQEAEFANQIPTKTQQLITIDGQYLDNKGNPITNADVEYFRDGTLMDDDITNANGQFELNVLVNGVGEEPIFQENKEPLSQNYPNPFLKQTIIDANIQHPGELNIYDVAGRKVAELDLPEKGRYKISWGSDKAVAEAGQIEKGEEMEWLIEDRDTYLLKLVKESMLLLSR
ncbi:MAG TPA: hypothetical protein ENN08_06255 [Bacteroidales bacterium]|nr:hypothetical protein [Bacteroidales bacterium]